MGVISVTWLRFSASFGPVELWKANDQSVVQGVWSRRLICALFYEVSIFNYLQIIETFWVGGYTFDLELRLKPW